MRYLKVLFLALIIAGLVVSACQTASKASPTPLPPATPLPPLPPEASAPGNPATPLPAVPPPTPIPPPATPRPMPTPIPLTGFDWKSVAYREYWPTDLSGDLSVGLGGAWIDIRDSGVILVNVKTGDKKSITEGGRGLTEVVISGDYIAWGDQSRQTEIPGSTARNKAGRLSVDIFVMNLVTGEQQRITEVPAGRRNLNIDGNLLVWQDNRNEIGERRSHYDIYAYDIEAGEEIAVEVAPGAQRYPVVSGHRIVWIDEGEGSARVILYDHTTKEKESVGGPATAERSHDIHGDHIVWIGFLDENPNDGIYLHDLASGQQRVIATPPLGNANRPLISDNYVVWTVGWNCDTGSNIMPDDMGVYVYDKTTDEVQRISNYVDPDAFIDGETLLVHEGCQFPWYVYAVFLE